MRVEVGASWRCCAFELLRAPLRTAYDLSCAGSD